MRTVIDLSYPKTVSEPVERLLSELSFKDKARIANLKESKIHILHNSTGLHIRVTYGLWFGNEELMESCRKKVKKSYLHVEDASEVILKELWWKLHKSHKIRLLKAVDLTTPELNADEMQENNDGNKNPY